MALTIALAQACAPVARIGAVPSEMDDTCGARQHAALIGQNATTLERVLILGQVRILRPGDAATLDHQPERINFRIDGTQRIAQITCG